jgi:hypothetical protein
MSNRAEWAKRVAAWEASGRDAAAFCEGRDYSARNLKWWAWRLRRSAAKPAPRSAGQVRFARVTAKREPKASSVIGITVGGARVEVGAVADRDTLMVVLEALLASAGGRK